MVSELTQLVKEQKGRITELAKAKQEQTAEYRYAFLCIYFCC